MRKITFLALLMSVVTLPFLTRTAAAGSKCSLAVTINTTTRLAQGEMGTVRNSSDTTQVMSCQLQGTPSSLSAACTARNAAGTMVSCTSTASQIVTVVGAITSDAYINFTYNASGICQSVTVSTSSCFELRKP